MIWGSKNLSMTKFWCFVLQQIFGRQPNFIAGLNGPKVGSIGMIFTSPVVPALFVMLVLLMEAHAFTILIQLIMMTARAGTMMQSHCMTRIILCSVRLFCISFTTD